MKRSIDQERRSAESSRSHVTVARKPLPPTPFSRHPLPPPPEEPEQHQSYRSDPFQPPDTKYQYDNAGATARDTGLRLNTGFNVGNDRKPVSLMGTSNLHSAAGDYASSAPIHEDQPMDSFRNFAPGNAQSNSRPTSPAPSYGLSDYPPQHLQEDVFSSQAPTNLGTAHRRDPKSLPVTIIRRDPASGSQWNIGTIKLLEPTFSGSQVRPISVELNTPGYGRFARGTGFETPRPGSARSDAASIKRAMQSATISPASATSPETPITTFNRIVDFRKMAMSDLKRTVYQRTNSSDSIGKTDPTKPTMEKNVLAFDSPWYGICTFVNAIDGTSLKIKHTISSNSSAAESITANVGELRFNLGWSLLSNIKESDRRQKQPEPDKIPIPELLKTKKENFRKSFQHIKSKSRESFQRSKSSNDSNDVLRDLSNIQTPTSNLLDDRACPQINAPAMGNQHNLAQNYHSSVSPAQPTSSEDNDEEGRLSLRLGREKAGGGFRGQSAKLGKLIIEDEGLKMCDLVVGAAMGVWWQHYGG